MRHGSHHGIPYNAPHLNGLGSASNGSLLGSNSTTVLTPKQSYLGDSNEKPNYVALFDYDQATTDDMTIKKNDPLIVINKNHPDWWLAKNLRTKQTGYVPYNYITSIDDLQIKEYFQFI